MPRMMPISHKAVVLVTVHLVSRVRASIARTLSTRFSSLHRRTRTSGELYEPSCKVGRGEASPSRGHLWPWIAVRESSVAREDVSRLASLAYLAGIDVEPNEVEPRRLTTSVSPGELVDEDGPPSPLVG